MKKFMNVESPREFIFYIHFRFLSCGDCRNRFADHRQIKFNGINESNWSDSSINEQSSYPNYPGNQFFLEESWRMAFGVFFYNERGKASILSKSGFSLVSLVVLVVVLSLVVLTAFTITYEIHMDSITQLDTHWIKWDSLCKINAGMSTI